MPFILHLTLGSSRFSSQPWSASIGSSGLWLLAGQGNSVVSAARATLAMSRRYSGVKFFGTARIQLVSLAIHFEMLRRGLEDVPANFQKFWKHPSLTWSQLGRYKLLQADVAALLERLGTALEPGGAHTSKGRLDHLLEVLGPLEQRGKTRRVVGRHHHRSQASRGRASADGHGLAEQVESSVSLRSASADGSLGEDAKVPNFHQVKEIQWFVLARSQVAHVVQELAGNRYVPLCRSTPFNVQVIDQGSDPVSQPLVLCTTCNKRLPSDVQAAIARGQVEDLPSAPSESSEMD